MFKRFANNSLRFRLIVILSGISLLIWFTATAIEWFKFREEMNKQFDTQQVLFAEKLASSNIMQGFHEIRPHHRRNVHHQKHINDDALAFAVFTERGDPIFNDGRDGQFIEFAPHRGFKNIRLIEHDDEEAEVDQWRIFWLKHRDLYIAVGQEIDYRNEIINDVMASKFWGGFIALPLLILAIWFIVTKELASLRSLQKQVLKRKPDETTPIQTADLPKEIQPLVQSLNRYFTRTQTMLSRERRFTSDAAHELRSPLAGLRIQTEIAQMTLDDPDTHLTALNNLTNGIDRIAQLIEQLLTLSRLENLEQLDELEPINWQTLIEQNVSQLYVQAENKRSEISVDLQSLPQNQQGKPLLLNLILRNLIDNAISYTPEGSKIKLTLTSNGLTIEDDGYGVSDEDLHKLGQPFYRPVDRPVQSDKDEKGSGLGISIIKRIVELHGFSMKLSRSEMGGLKVEILF